MRSAAQVTQLTLKIVMRRSAGLHVLLRPASAPTPSRKQGGCGGITTYRSDMLHSANCYDPTVQTAGALHHAGASRKQRNTLSNTDGLDCRCRLYTQGLQNRPVEGRT
jgi:hypothetical protein